MKNSFWGWALLGLLWSVACAGLALADPLYDPFLEDFQVGLFSDPGQIELSGGWPVGLRAAALLDTAWTASAHQVLQRGRDNLTQRFLRHLHADDAGAETWLADARQALRALEEQRAGNPSVDFLRYERLVRSYGTATEPAKIAAQIVTAADSLGLAPRQLWTWRMRAEWQPAAAWWPSLADMGSFDVNNAWALWVAMRRELAEPIFPPGLDGDILGGVVSRVRRGWFGPDELAESTLSQDWRAGLGAILLPKNSLEAHFKIHSQPPSDFSKQGWWVQGQRRMRHGRAASYESLASRSDLKPAWQMDVWRRASELRILRGAWVEGLADLTSALELARSGHGTKGLRKRLRQWTVQAMVLALAQDDLAVARRLRQMGLDHFQSEDLTAFEGELAPWATALQRGGAAATAASDDAVDQARFLIVTGQAPDVQRVTVEQREAFITAADQQLWTIWFSWGLALADTSAVTESRRAGAVAYRQGLLAGRSATETKALADAALALVAMRFGGRDWLPQLIRQAFDLDTGRISGWRTPPRPSIVPNLLPAVRGSELDRHALLGFCLATGDMRGILGLAFELPARGLTREQKRLFLYPLPGPGPIREALLAADSEPALLLAVARNESLFEPAVRSQAGALGWMQIMPFHYPQSGANFGPLNWRFPATSIQRGDGLLSENRRRFKGDPYRVLAAYNAGPKAAARWDEQLGERKAERDIYLAWIGYPETRAYVEKVLIDREIYRDIIDTHSE